MLQALFSVFVGAQLVHRMNGQKQTFSEIDGEKPDGKSKG
jgi:hypothetical protein